MEQELTPMEDLMREHGILNRILLIYDEFIYRISNNISFSYKLLYSSAMMIRFFIEDHHEKTEENYVFPLLLKNNDNIEFVLELIDQHKYG
jgi:hemerythrin-like domain-containing protein